MILTIYTEPPLVIHDAEDPGAAAHAFRALLPVGTLRQEAALDGGGENANVTAAIDNGDGALTAYLEDPPLGVRATLTEQGETLVDGSVSAVSLGASAEIEIES